MVADPRFIPRQGRTANPHNAFTLAERDRRWNATRQAMEERGIDCLFIVGKGWNEVGNCRWLDNNDHIERHLIFPLKGNPVLLWLLDNWGKWYLENGWEGVEFRATHGNTTPVAAETIAELGYGSGTIGVVGLVGGGLNPEGSIPYMSYRALTAFLPDATFKDASDLMMRLRMIKSSEEIAFIEKASEIANVEIDAVMAHARPGIRESELIAEVMYASLKAGNEVGRDHFTILCSGNEGYPVNRRMTDRIMRTGDVVHVGHYTRFGGYWSHPHIAVSLGPLEDEYKPMRDAVREATDRAMALLKPGTPWSELDAEVDKPIVSRGYYHEIPQLHCVGIDGIEGPATALVRGDVPQDAPWRRPMTNRSVSDLEEFAALTVDRKPPGDLMVQPGMAVAVEVKAAKDDRIYVEFGPQVVIEEGGPRVLTPDAMDLIEL
ncbi:MAG: M24 family metallopeptidase [Defluviicoccus sp.]|nr:M24 family metallopeptidase [Defluviicoccus sp.]MDE0385378.1 M24 family metallopeptidase [Defluviicoccus sp.]